MNTFNRFVVTILFILFSLQVFATRPYITKIERINTTTLRVNFDQPIKSHIGFLGLHIRGENNVFYTEANSTNVSRNILNYDTNALVRYLDWIEPALATMDTVVGLKTAKVRLTLSLITNGAEEIALIRFNAGIPFELCEPSCNSLNITSINTLNINEGTPSSTHTLIASDTTATFSITENTNGLFSLSGTNNATLTFNGTNTDFESDTKSYTVKVKATTGDGENKNAEQTFTITLDDVLDTAPVINQFTISQGGNKGRLISKDGGDVTVHAMVGTGTYAWSSDDFSGVNSSNTSTSVTFAPSASVGTRAIKFQVTAGDYSSERILKLKLVDSYPNGRVDENGNGIADDKETGHNSNELLAGEGKKITSPASTRILLGIMGEDSGYLTLNQMKAYITENNLTNYNKDTLTTGDIYNYVIENLSATGVTTEVIIELTTAIPRYAELRRYSLTTGHWTKSSDEDGNKIQSKQSNDCTDSSTWQTGLVVNATCLKLTIKDGGNNDADGNQNGVIESTIAIANPIIIDDDNNTDSVSSSGGGCVYNPNAPARFDMGFILLMVLSAYYLIRRKRRFVY